MLKITAAQIVAIDAYNRAHAKLMDAIFVEDGGMAEKAAAKVVDALHPAFVAAGGQWVAHQIRPWMRRKLAAEIADELRAAAYDDAETFGREVAQ